MRERELADSRLPDVIGGRDIGEIGESKVQRREHGGVKCLRYGGAIMLMVPC